MGLSLNFKVVPASPYHTLNFHMNRGVKQKLYEPGSDGESWLPFLSHVAEALQILNQIPDDFFICILPSKLYASVIIRNLFTPGVHLLPVHPSITDPSPIELIDSGWEEKFLTPEGMGRGQKEVKNGSILCREVDLISGYSINLQEFFPVKEDRPGVFLCLDISTSFANHSYDYEKVDAYLFNSDFVFGMKSGITVLILHDSILKWIRQKWAGEFYSPGIGTDHDLPDILYHREIDPLKLYVFKEMCWDLVRRDRKIIRNEVIYKSILIGNALEQSETFDLMVKKEADRSPNVISACILRSPEKVREHFRDYGIKVDEMYEENYGHIIRFGNFPVHSKEQAEFLSDCIASLG